MRGFSLLELVMAIVIIGVIAAIAAPRFSNAGQNASYKATRATWNIFENAMFLYEANYSAFPPTMRKGEFEDALRDFMKESDWLAPTPMGGNWVFANAGSVGIGIQQDPVPTALWLGYDRLFDDGTLNAGRLQVKTNIYLRNLVGATTVITPEVDEPDIVELDDR